MGIMIVRVATFPEITYKYIVLYLYLAFVFMSFNKAACLIYI